MIQYDVATFLLVFFPGGVSWNHLQGLLDTQKTHHKQYLQLTIAHLREMEKLDINIKLPSMWLLFVRIFIIDIVSLVRFVVNHTGATRMRKQNFVSCVFLLLG